MYIGLLMAGSAPGVVAQQAGAMTRNFELSEEVEAKDDLDLKPEGRTELSDLQELLSSPSFEPLVRVYLSQFAVSSAESGTIAVRLDSSAWIETTNTRLSQNLFNPNDIRSSSDLTVSCFPRSGLEALLAKDAK